MNAVYLHLVLCHIPVFLLIGGFLLLILTFFRKSDDIRTLSLALMALAGFIVIPVFLSGESAEVIVEKISGIQEGAIQTHEEDGEIALWSVLAAGLLALAAFLFQLKKRPCPKWLMIPLLAAAVFATANLLITAKSGGLIRHTEISEQSSSPVDKNHDLDN